MRAVIYARYSSDNQREESIEGQIRECSAYAEKNGITVLRHYIDRAFSAKTDNRPEFQQMIRDSNRKVFDLVIVWKLDRFARNRYDSARYKSILKKNGIRVVSATEVISEGAEGIILESVLEGYAEYFSADLAEKVIRGQKENALKCKSNGGSVPIGYAVDKELNFQIDPATAPFVLEAFKRYDNGESMKSIRNWLNENGVKNARGKAVSYNTVERLLKNRRYIGEYAFRDVVIPDGIPAIVPPDLFDRVQEKIAVNRRMPARHKAEDDYLLTAKLFCGSCGAMLFGECGTGRSGVTHRYYKCASVKRKSKPCSCQTFRKQWLEDLVINEAVKKLKDDRVTQAITSAVLLSQEAENTTLPLLEKQYQETESAINNLLNAIQQGILTKSTKNRLEELEKLRDDLESRILMEKMEKPKVTEEQVKCWLERFQDLDPTKTEHRRLLIDVLVNSVKVYKEYMTIYLNFTEGCETVAFDETRCSPPTPAPGSDIEFTGVPKSARISSGGFFFYNSMVSSSRSRTLTPGPSSGHSRRLRENMRPRVFSSSRGKGRW